MILFLFYAVFVWYLCFRYRRNWRGLVIFVASMAALWLLADLYRVAIRWAKVNRHAFLDTRNDGQLFLMLLAVEAVIVAAVGLFFWCLPRAGAVKPCRKCGYELAGLDDDNPTCPESRPRYLRSMHASAARVSGPDHQPRHSRRAAPISNASPGRPRIMTNRVRSNVA